MKVAFSPEDKIGRMLHNFSCTACEIADYTSDNLKKYNLLKTKSNENLIPQWKSINLNGRNPASTDKNMKVISNPIYINIPSGSSITSIHFNDMWPGELITLSFKDEMDKII
jgi:hypothetical protein